MNEMPGTLTRKVEEERQRSARIYPFGNINTKYLLLYKLRNISILTLYIHKIW